MSWRDRLVLRLIGAYMIVAPRRALTFILDVYEETS